MAKLSKVDSASFSNIDEFESEKLHFAWHIDHETRKVSGCVSITIKRVKPAADILTLDIRDLDVNCVNLSSGGSSKALEFRQLLPENPDHKSLGQCLAVSVPSDCDDQFQLEISYSTRPECSALQWLSAAQTSGKAHPYMYSQCQAIHARSLFPCQDCPRIKTTFTANVTCAAPLTVLMGALDDDTNTHTHTQTQQDDTHAQTRKFAFSQPIPVPAYLVSVACGNLRGVRVGPRSTVWSEPEEVERAAAEYSETERMLATAEEICGMRYVWGKYDLLCLPPSFPYGGMENPCLTFITPTTIAGDKSLTSVVAHEITHSWTGNLVTNADWNDFWINEGHTRYVERLILGRIAEERVRGSNTPMRHLQVGRGLTDLRDAVDQFGVGHAYTALVLRESGHDPDDSFSRVPYEKGSLLLFFIEQLVGETAMMAWLRAYLKRYARRCLDSAEWRDFLLKFMREEQRVEQSVLDKIDWQFWFYHRGHVEWSLFTLDTSFIEQCRSLSNVWLEMSRDGGGPDVAQLKARVAQLQPEQLYLYLQLINNELQIVLDAATLEKFRAVHDIPNLTNEANESGGGKSRLVNFEVLYEWMRLCVRSKYTQIVPEVFAYLQLQGRMKYIRPLYRALYAWEEHRSAAVAHFKAQIPQLNPIAVKMLEEDLHLNE